MKDPERNDLRGDEVEDLFARALKGALNEQEGEALRARLERDPGFRARFEQEQALERLLHEIPDAPLSSNFTALVMQRAELESRQPRSHTPRPLRWFRFAFARVAAGLAAIAVIGLAAVHQFQKAQREDIARNIRSFTTVASAIASEKTPSVQVFQDFDAIQHLSLPPRADLDLELLVALEK